MKFAHLQAMQMAPHFAKIEIPAPAGISICLLRAAPPSPFEQLRHGAGCAFWQNALFTFTTKLQFIS